MENKSFAVTRAAKVLFINAADTARHISSANTAIYPNLGLLTLMSSVSAAAQERGSAITCEYLDGTVVGNQQIRSYIEEHAPDLFAICFSALTANYGASIELAKIARKSNPNIVVILGNDHFSACYEQVLRNQPAVNFGFYGSDVVEGFSELVTDLWNGNLKDFTEYPGLAYRTPAGDVRRNPESPEEFHRLPLVDYSLADTLFAHTDRYLTGQRQTYHFMRGRNLRSQVVDIGRGCIKFAGRRDHDIPINACDFCGIIPGAKAIVAQSSRRAWAILENAYRQDYNYFYITADELPLTLWSLLRSMANDQPDWYRDLAEPVRPKMFGYARAEGFATHPEKIDIIIRQLGFDHFFVGFDGLSEVSLQVMNKGPTRQDGNDLLSYNVRALNSLVQRGALLTAGLVVTHLGITPHILTENYRLLEEMVSANPRTFAALDFGPLCPIPGSQAFRYLVNPDFAERKAKAHGLNINRGYLESVSKKYADNDLFDMNELIADFTVGCCPDINQQLVEDHLSRIADLAERHSIVIGGGV